MYIYLYILSIYIYPCYKVEIIINVKNTRRYEGDKLFKLLDGKVNIEALSGYSSLVKIVAAGYAKEGKYL